MKLTMRMKRMVAVVAVATAEGCIFKLHLDQESVPYVIMQDSNLYNVMHYRWMFSWRLKPLAMASMVVTVEMVVVETVLQMVPVLAVMAKTMYRQNQHHQKPLKKHYL